MSEAIEKGKVITANRLSDGTVVFLAEVGGWSEDIDSALVAVDPEAVAALSEHGRQAEAVNHVTGSYLIDVERRDGQVLPVHIRERIRTQGPTIPYGQQAEHQRGSAAAARLKEAGHVSL